jgi:hypothetical protein
LALASLKTDEAMTTTVATPRNRNSFAPNSKPPSFATISCSYGETDCPPGNP